MEKCVSASDGRYSIPTAPICSKVNPPWKRDCCSAQLPNVLPIPHGNLRLVDRNPSIYHPSINSHLAHYNFWNLHPPGITALTSCLCRISTDHQRETRKKRRKISTAAAEAIENEAPSPELLRAVYTHLPCISMTIIQTRHVTPEMTHKEFITNKHRSAMPVKRSWSASSWCSAWKHPIRWARENSRDNPQHPTCGPRGSILPWVCYADDRSFRIMPYVYTDDGLTPFFVNGYSATLCCIGTR